MSSCRDGVRSRHQESPVVARDGRVHDAATARHRDGGVGDRVSLRAAHESTHSLVHLPQKTHITTLVLLTRTKIEAGL